MAKLFCLKRLAAAIAGVALWSEIAWASVVFSEESLRTASNFIRANPGFPSGFIREVRRVLATLTSTRRHNEFLSRRGGVDMLIVDPGREMEEDFVAQYYRRSIYLNRTLLVLQANDLAKRGIPLARAAEIIAWKMVPTLAHEIRHAMIQAELRARVGADCPGWFLENELLAFSDQAMVMQEAVSEKPQFWEEPLLLHIDEENRILLEQRGRGRKALVNYVRELYPKGAPILGSQRQALLRDADQEREALDRELQSIQGLARALERASDPTQRQALQEEFDGLRPKEEVVHRLELNSRCRSVLASPDKFRLTLNFYRHALSALP